MAFIEKIQTYLSGLDSKLFTRYLMIILGIILALCLVIVVNFYWTTSSLKTKLTELNELREGEVKEILGKIENVKKQRAEVNTILKQDPSFKIGGYFNKILTELGLLDNKKEETTSQVDLDDNYRESSLAAKFIDMNMKQLTELLNVVEQNKRISTKRLEIVKSTKNPKSIDVALTIATLQPKSAVPE